MRRALVLGLCSVACVSTGAEAIDVPLAVAGTALEAPIEGRDGASIVLSSAELAFGPLYLCAGAQAGDLCDTARLEWLDAAVVDVLDPSATEVGELSGISGTVRSWMYDLGFSSLLTQDDPLVLPAAEELSRASVRLSGTATVGEVALPFSVAIPIRAEQDTERGVPLVRKSGSDVFEHEVTPDEPGLRVVFDAAPWVADVDFAALVPDEACGPDGPAIACAGPIEHTCAADGTVAGQRDCRDDAGACVSGFGCLPEIEIAAPSQAASAVRNAVVAGPRPTFQWGQ